VAVRCARERQWAELPAGLHAGQKAITIENFLFLFQKPFSVIFDDL
jgi:hypothetical protein